MSSSVFPFSQVEEKWQKYWDDHKVYDVGSNDALPKAYVLEMCPYPSGRIHMGHVRNYTIGDVIARHKRMMGCNVLHPISWDAFGLPAENAARNHGGQPAQWTYENIDGMRTQLKALGFSYAWSREFASCHPDYYRHEQKIFLDFYKKGLCYQKKALVNWDPVEQSVLANEQVVDGRGWRSGALVEKRELTQWYLKITDYAQELLDDLSSLTGWPQKVLTMQENWIGRSQGAFIQFEIIDASQKLDVYTTRPETLFGASFCAVAPNHPLAENLAKNNAKLQDFIDENQKGSVSEAAQAISQKEGFDTGLKVKNPFNGDHLPLYVANFVLMDYGTGAIFACPAHDERDFEFAIKYNLPIKRVVADPKSDVETPLTQAYTGFGTMVNSQFLNDLSAEDARKIAIEKLEQMGIGRAQTNYRLRDWGVSRQRYWGCPIPMIYCDDCGVVAVHQDQLPVVLPDDVDFEKGGNPLEHHPTWKHTNCPKCNKPAIRETDTLDTFFESSWYFLRSTGLTADKAFDKNQIDQWLPVEWYIGGIEHAVMHLLYARFFVKALRDCGYLNLSEPFKNLLTQGMVCHQTFQDKNKNWLYPQDVEKNNKGQFVVKKTGELAIAGRSEKMSKSKKNLVDPQKIIETYGADAARLFILSDTPVDRDFDWNEEALDGSWRFLNRVWRLVHDVKAKQTQIGDASQDLKIKKTLHQTIDKINHAMAENGFNKVIAFIREFTKSIEEQLENASGSILIEACSNLVLLLSPITPHLADELWEILGKDYNQKSWPQVDAALALRDEITIAVQMNGKTKTTFQASPGLSNDDLQSKALELEPVKRDMQTKTIKKVIVIPDRIINFVVV